MKTTKPKLSIKEVILQTSLELMNELGLPNVSQRKITDKLDISPGNLTYHFKKKDDIIIALYRQLVDVIGSKLGEVSFTKVDLNFVKEITIVQLESYYKYRFIVLDLIHVLRNYPEIAKHYNNLMNDRKEQYDYFIQYLVNDHIIREPEFKEEYQNLYVRFQILSRFWVSQASLNNFELNDSEIINYAKLVLESFYPYFTDKGKKEWEGLKW